MCIRDRSNSLRELVEKAIKTKKIVTVEVENVNQLKQILGLKFKRILFDNMNFSQLKNCLKLCKNKYETEYSGNATLKNIKQILGKNINLSDVSLFSDGKSIYVITSNNEMLDLIKQGQAVFGISLGPIHTETEAEIHSLYPEKISAKNA